jgi:pimeloyl-ACP methyl ester carboxylesterase
MRFLPSVLFCTILTAAPAAAKPAATCIGPTAAKGHLIYLHGLTPPEKGTNEEAENLKVLEQLAQELSLRVALPRGPLCPSGKLCWPAKDREETLKTFEALRAQAHSCWSGNPEYHLVGFSNGGYFALKLYKAHNDPQLKRIIASGSAGTWDPKSDKPHPHSSFALMIGQQDITLKKASQLAATLRKAIPGFRFETFPGGHRLEAQTLRKLLGSP